MKIFEVLMMVFIPLIFDIEYLAEENEKSKKEVSTLYIFVSLAMAELPLIYIGNLEEDYGLLAVMLAGVALL